MEELVIFFSRYGVWITLFAIIGVAGLGVMKYCNLFKKIEESKRHYIYLGISLGFSIIATGIYLYVVGAFNWNYLLTISGAMYALNQTFYSIFKVTPINDLAVKLLDWVVGFFKKDKVDKEPEKTEE